MRPSPPTTTAPPRRGAPSMVTTQSAWRRRVLTRSGVRLTGERAPTAEGIQGVDVAVLLRLGTGEVALHEMEFARAVRPRQLSGALVDLGDGERIGARPRIGGRGAAIVDVAHHRGPG